ncbi:MAG: hypothetical protein ACUVSS_11490, partial [Anaerolineae bacterium]
MRKHRVVTFVAILIFVAALVYLVLGLLGAWSFGRSGVGVGWGTGWRGWIVIPMVVSMVFSALTLLLLGAVLLFLARIENNLSLARQRRREQAARRAAAPAAAVTAPVPTAPAVIVPEVEVPIVEAEAPRVEAPAVTVEPPKVEVETPV